MASFNTFEFIQTQNRVLIACKKTNCSAPQADCLSEQGKDLYSKSGFQNQINDCLSDVTLTCKTCGNTETAIGIQGIHC